MLAASIEDLRKRTAMFRLGRLPDRVDQVCDEHLAILEALHCDMVQGYLFSRPLPGDAFVAWCTQFQREQAGA